MVTTQNCSVGERRGEEKKTKRGNKLGHSTQERERERMYTVSMAFKTCSLVPRLSLRTNKKSKEREEPGKIHHVRNVIGRENLITCGQTNELAHAV